MENTTLAYGLGLLATICAIVFGYAAFRRNQKRDSENEGSLKSDIGYIKAGIDDLKKQQEKSDERYVGLVCKVAEVESSTRQAHKRIDEHLAEGRG